MKILITGAAGFIGSHTAERLNAAGHDVVGIDNLASYYDVRLKTATLRILEQQGIVVHKADLADGDLQNIAGNAFDYIIHFAAQPGIAEGTGFEDYLRNNVIATHELTGFAQKNNHLKMLVNISTSSVYGIDATHAEDHAPEPVSFYGITKLAAEQLVLKQSRLKAMGACSLRLYSVYGPRERPDKLFTRLINAALTGTTFNLFEGSEKHLRSFTYVGDIVDGITSVIGKEKICNGQIINLGNETEHTTQYGIDCVRELTGFPLNIEQSGRRAGDQLRTKAYISKAARLLNYRPQTTLRQGLQFQIDWQKELLKK